MKKNDFYDMTELKKHNADYNILLGERSNGKSFQVKMEMIKTGLDSTQITSALIRRYEEDIRATYISTYFDDEALKKYITDSTDGKYNCVDFYQRRFYFAHYDEESTKIERGHAFCIAFALAEDERYKSSTVFPKIKIVSFEEFITNRMYLKDEVRRFMNLCSTIIRLNKAKIYLIGNTISRVCVYYNEWCLRGVTKMKEGQIDEYIFKDSQNNDVKICVELCKSPQHKKSGMFFGRIGQQIESGAWACAEHPHLKGDFSEYDVLYSMTLKHLDFKFNVVLCQHIEDGFLCVYVYPSTMKTHERILSEEYSENVLQTPNLMKSKKIERIIAQLVVENKVVYPTNLIGEDFLTTLKNMNSNPFILK